LEGHSDIAPPKGWRPANGDHSHSAVAWRAKTALRQTRQNTRELKKLTPAVEALTATLKASDEAWAARWSVLSKLMWGVGIPVLVAIVLGVGAVVVKWVSTLHH
jgi:hypothetical protein